MASAEKIRRSLIRGLSQDALGLAATSGSMSGERFVESAGGGVFAEVLVRAEEDDRDVGGESKLEFGLRALREIVDETPAVEWDVEMDGIELRGNFLSVEAMNVRELGPNIPLAPSSDPGDGMLDLALIREDHRVELVAYLDARLADREAEPPTLDVYRASRIVLRPPGASPVHLDDRLERGEALADDAGRIMVGLDGGLTVLVPAGA